MPVSPPSPQPPGVNLSGCQAKDCKRLDNYRDSQRPRTISRAIYTVEKASQDLLKRERIENSKMGRYNLDRNPFEEKP